MLNILRGVDIENEGSKIRRIPCLIGKIF